MTEEGRESRSKRDTKNHGFEEEIYTAKRTNLEGEKVQKVKESFQTEGKEHFVNENNYCNC